MPSLAFTSSLQLYDPTAAPGASVADPLQLDLLLIGLARGLHFPAHTDLRHGDVPPVAAGLGADQRIGVDDDHRRAIGLLRPLQRRLEIGDRLRLLTDRAEAFGM